MLPRQTGSVGRNSSLVTLIQTFIVILLTADIASLVKESGVPEGATAGMPACHAISCAAPGSSNQRFEASAYIGDSC